MDLHLADADGSSGALRWPRLKAAALLAAMSALTLNLVTGSPLLAIWVGARVQGSGPPTMGAFFTFVCSFAVTSYVLVRAIAAVSRSYDALTGRRPTVRAHVPWLRSLRGERPAEMGSKAGLSALDVILVLVVLAAVVAFELWFFFYSGSPIDQRSGRV